MTAEEYFENWTASQKKFTTWREGSVQFAEAYHTYRLAFERENKQSTADPYYTDPATWPEWANWTAVNKDGEMWFYALEPYVEEAYHCWWLTNGAKFEFSCDVKHNPNWSNSLRSREEVSRGN